MVKNLPANAGDIRDTGSTPGLGRSPGEGNGNPLQYFCLENPTDRGALWTTVSEVAQSQTQLSDLAAAAAGEFEDRDHLCLVHGILPNRAATL